MAILLSAGFFFSRLSAELSIARIMTNKTDSFLMPFGRKRHEKMESYKK